MNFNQADDDDDDDEPEHSLVGIASFAITCLAGMLEFMSFAYAGFLESATPGGIDENSPKAIAIGLVIIGGLGMAVLGIGLGIAGLFQREQKRVFPALGVVIGTVVLLGVAGLMVIGLMSD